MGRIARPYVWHGKRSRLAPVTFALLVCVALASAGLTPVRAETSASSIPACGATPSSDDHAFPSSLPMEMDSAPAPTTTAQAAVVVDGETGRVL